MAIDHVISAGHGQALAGRVLDEILTGFGRVAAT